MDSSHAPGEAAPNLTVELTWEFLGGAPPGVDLNTPPTLEQAEAAGKLVWPGKRQAEELLQAPDCVHNKRSKPTDVSSSGAEDEAAAAEVAEDASLAAGNADEADSKADQGYAEGDVHAVGGDEAEAWHGCDTGADVAAHSGTESSSRSLSDAPVVEYDWWQHDAVNSGLVYRRSYTPDGLEACKAPVQKQELAAIDAGDLWEFEHLYEAGDSY